MNILYPKTLLYVEGAIVGVMSLFLYARSSGDWLLFGLLLLAPDISILGYLVGSRVGAMTYNIIHVYFLPATLVAYGLLAAQAFPISLALIWFAHIGFDRLLGFGLKYPTGFMDTHLGRI